VDNINPNICQLSPRIFGFFYALFGEADVSPTGESVGCIPYRLAVTDQNESGHVRTLLLPGSEPRLVENQTALVAPSPSHQQNVLGELPLGLSRGSAVEVG
jgi:hypothetical protein